MPDQPVSIIIDPYRHKCKSFRKNSADVKEEIQLFSSDTYDLSWVGESRFWRRLHIDVMRLEDGATIQTNNSFIHDCLIATVSRSKELFSKKFIVIPPEETKDDFEQRLQALLKYLPQAATMPVKKIPVYISEKSRAVWNSFVTGTEATFKKLYLEFEETDKFEQTDFILIQQDEFPEFQEKKYSICFVLDTSSTSECNDIYPDENGTNGFIWNLSGHNLMSLIRFVDFFYLKSRFIEIAEFCIKEANIETLEDAQELIALWRSCDKDFSADENADDNLFLLVDNSRVPDVKLTQKASFDLRRFYDNTWINDEGLTLTIDIPVNYNIGESYDCSSDVRYLYKKNYNAEVKDVFVFTPEKCLISTIFSDSKNTTVKLKLRVIADGGVDTFGIRNTGKVVADKVYAYPLGSTHKFHVWVDNRREYDEKAHPLLCTLNGEKYSFIGIPERNKSEVVYTYEIKFSEVKNYVFKVQLDGVTGCVECTFQVLPYPDTVLSRVKPVQQRQQLISVEHASAVVDYCRAPVKKITCFPGITFKFEKAAFNKGYYPASAAGFSTEDRIFKGDAPCYDKNCSWELIDSNSICQFTNQSSLKILKTGNAVIRLKSDSNTDLYQEIKIAVLSDKSQLMCKLICAGLLVSFISAFWYGAHFWALLCKAFCPALVYYAGTHPAECLNNTKVKIIFFIALIFSFSVLFRGLWQEI